VLSECIMAMPSAAGIHTAGGGTSNLEAGAAAEAMRIVAAHGPSAGATRSSSMDSGRVASALLQEATPTDNAETNRRWRRQRLTSPGPAPGPASVPFSVSSSGCSVSSGAGLAAHQCKPKRLRILGVPPLVERQPASLNTLVTNGKETAKYATEAAEFARAAIASAALPGPRPRSFDCTPVYAEPKQVLHASLSPARRNGQVLRTKTGELASAALRQALRVASTCSSAAMQPSAVSHLPQFQGPSAEVQSCCLPQHALQSAASNTCSSSLETRANRALLLKRRRGDQPGNMNPVLPANSAFPIAGVAENSSSREPSPRPSGLRGRR